MVPPEPLSRLPVPSWYLSLAASWGRLAGRVRYHSAYEAGALGPLAEDGQLSRTTAIAVPHRNAVSVANLLLRGARGAAFLPHSSRNEIDERKTPSEFA